MKGCRLDLMIAPTYKEEVWLSGTSTTLISLHIIPTHQLY